MARTDHLTSSTPDLGAARLVSDPQESCTQPIHCILATAGHVDHGKSSLVRALTGTDPDRLPEEKARQITIDLGFARMALRAGDALLEVGVVDVPGHEDFVRNMIAGVGAVDAALLVVAADDGWMPQTEEHLQILEYLGVSRAVVALTKSDLCEDCAAAAERVRVHLRASPFESAAVVPVSTVSGRGLDELRQAIAAALCSGPPPRDISKPRLSVDRAFSVAGIGTVVTGTLVGGVLERGQAVHVQPTGAEARIRSIQSHGRALEQARPGMRVALGLPSLNVGQRSEPGAIRRGDEITPMTGVRASDAADVVLFRSGRDRSTSRELRHGVEIRVHHGTDSTPARLCLARSAPGPGESVAAQLRFEHPVFLFAGDRLILRDATQRWTLGGAAVLNPCASRRGFRARAKDLDPNATMHIETHAMVTAALAGRRWCERDGLLTQSRVGGEEVERAIADLIARGELIQTSGVVADAQWWKQMRARACNAIDILHESHPEQSGLDLRELRRTLEPDLTGRGAEAMIADLCRTGFFRTASIIRRAEHRPRLPARLREAGDRLRRALAAAGNNPPSRAQLAPDPLSEQALKFLIINGEAIEISAQVALGAEAYSAAAEAVRAHLAVRRQATVSQLGAALGAPRRIMVPLLERFDREGITLRRGDVRVLCVPTAEPAGAPGGSAR